MAGRPLTLAINTRLLLPGKLEGIGWFTWEIFRRLAAQHPEVEFHFIFDRPYDPGFLPSKNVIGHHCPPPARHPILYRIWYDWTLPRLLNRIKPDLFISPDCYASLRTSVPQLTVIHDINFEHYPGDVPKSYLRYLKSRTPRFVAKSKRLITVSEFTRQDIISTYQCPVEKLDVIPNGVSELFRPLDSSAREAARASWAGGNPYFIFVGSLHPRKNLQRLLPAFDQFKISTGLPHQLVIVGETFWMNSEMSQALEILQNKDAVHFTGRLQPEDLVLATGGAEASVYPSYFEGFGIPVLEAFKSGVPVIAGNRTSIPEVAGDAALLVDPFSVDAIERALEQVATSELLRAELAEKGLSRVARYSWDRSAELMWQSILKTIDHRNVRA